MYASYEDIHRAHSNSVRIPIVWVAIVLSLLVHLAAMWEFLPRLSQLSLEGPDKQGISPLSVKLAAPPGPRTTPSAPAAPDTPAIAAATIRPPPPRPLRPSRPSPAPPPVAVIPPTPDTQALRMPPPVAPPAAPAPPQTRPPIETDMASYIAARRRERGEPEPSGSQGVAPNAPPVNDERARRDKIVAENLASVRTPTFGGEPRNGGGMFQLRQLGLDEAQFMFFGWNTDIRRKVNQRIDVQRGNNPDIRIAVVRKIIAIIRTQESGNFRWQSLRLGRDLNLSARVEDTAELEAFMMREFFENDQSPR
ncbi:MAG: hypothetical protein ABI777_10255 [Betaproteobacteria bacterium]